MCLECLRNPLQHYARMSRRPAPLKASTGAGATGLFRIGFVGSVEEFWELTTDQYAELHRAPSVRVGLASLEA